MGPTTMALEYVEVRPPGRHDATVIWLHGLGADGHDFEPLVPELHLPEDHGVRFVFPHAPRRPITINAGMTMRGWYDITSLEMDHAEDAAGIEASSAELETLLAAEQAAGIAPARTVLAGFSQGGAIALHCGLRHGAALAGIIALSSYLPLPDRLERERSTAAAATPVFMAHGTADPLVPAVLGERSRDRLQAAGHSVAWHTYPMEHAVCAAEIADLAAWLKARLAMPARWRGEGNR